MDRFRAMTVFVAAAQSGSLSGAARQLSMPLTTVSRHLAWLETHVGTTLIARTTRHMALTDAGIAYLEVCRRVLDDLDGAESALAGRGRELAGDFTMTAPIAAANPGGIGFYLGMCWGTDAGALVSPGSWMTIGGSNVITIGKAFNNGNWTNSGSKKIDPGFMTYEIA